jgi:hypothetical protein
MSESMEGSIVQSLNPGLLIARTVCLTRKALLIIHVQLQEPIVDILVLTDAFTNRRRSGRNLSRTSPDHHLALDIARIG